MRKSHQSAPLNYRFAIGNMVRLSRTVPMRNAVSGLYRVLAQLPARQGEFQYRIKSELEPYQRIVREDELDPA